MGALTPVDGDAESEGIQLANPDSRLVSRALLRLDLGEHGLPRIRLELAFARSGQGVLNPHMAAALLIDRSGSMARRYRSGDVVRVQS